MTIIVSYILADPDRLYHLSWTSGPLKAYHYVQAGLGMSFLGNFPHIQVGKEPRSGTKHDNMKKNQGTNKAEKEDDTDSTATKTTAAFTSNCESDWDNYTDDGITEAPTLKDHTYRFRRTRWMKPARKWRKPTLKVCKEKQSSPTLDTAGHGQARTIKGVFMFWSAAQKATKRKSALAVLQESQSQQKPLGN